MSLFYCQQCGEPTEYQVTRPNFCCACRFPFNEEARAKLSQLPKKAPKIQAAQIQEDEDEDREDNDLGELLPDYIDPSTVNPKMEVEIKKPRIRRETIGQIAVGKKVESLPRRKAEGGSSKKNFLKEWKKEAGSIREK